MDFREINIRGGQVTINNIRRSRRTRSEENSRSNSSKERDSRHRSQSKVSKKKKKKSMKSKKKRSKKESSSSELTSNSSQMSSDSSKSAKSNSKKQQKVKRKRSHSKESKPNTLMSNDSNKNLRKTCNVTKHNNLQTNKTDPVCLPSTSKKKIWKLSLEHANKHFQIIPIEHGYLDLNELLDGSDDIITKILQLTKSGSTKFILVYNEQTRGYVIKVRKEYAHLSLSNVKAVYEHDGIKLNRHERCLIYSNKMTYSSSNNYCDNGILEAGIEYRMLYNCRGIYQFDKGPMPLASFCHHVDVENAVELITDFHVLTQAGIECELCINCKTVVYGPHDCRKPNNSKKLSLGDYSAITGSLRNGLNNFLLRHFEGMSSTDIYNKHRLNIVGKIQKNMSRFKVMDIKVMNNKNFYQLIQAEWVEIEGVLHQLTEVVQGSLKYNCYECFCKCKFGSKVLFIQHFKTCDASGFISAVNVSRKLQNLPLLT